ncbi:YcaO-like family protein [Nostoc sp. FACHB-152]|uniref:YcaO-like family protein n=1 Tax=unclassified Nostoc TaxID=2593658 RepID=UPI00168266B0|nr:MULTISPECIES: YcaO-like family protein [unclassified Nostoc]MBD2451886.1 YcaO-like family protein [Nostoc sp. FACHB-152]MBD2472527.1 YcaO-like family protein [Nostoc sp. FACHB-145]
MLEQQNQQMWQNLIAPKLNLDGTFRTQEPQATWERLQEFLPAFGITRIADITGLDCIGIPVAQAIRPNGKAFSGSQGKGISLMLAMISAAMESVESYHAENLPEPEIVASYEEVCRHHQAIAPSILEPGKRWAAYDPTQPLDWICGTDLFTNQPVYVPQAYLDLDTTTEKRDTGIFSTSSNGLASGNHLLEAIAHGLFEVIEREAEWRWWQLLMEQRINCLVDIQTIKSPLLQSLLQQIQLAGAKAVITDLSSTVGIPTYKCLISDIENWYGRPTTAGWGCHSSKEIALARAITEAAQSRVTIIAGSRDDIHPESYALGSFKLPGSPTTKFSGKRPTATFIDFETQPELPPTSTFGEEIQQILDCLRNLGFDQAVFVNHTRVEFGFPVVHVVVPGTHLPSSY